MATGYNKMTLRDAVEKAVGQNDVYLMSKVFEKLRMRFDYQASMDFVINISNDLGFQISQSKLEGMLYEASADSELC